MPRHNFFSFSVYIGDEILPEYELERDEFYIESDFTSLEGYKVPADRDLPDSCSDESGNAVNILVIPYRVVVRTARHAPSCWYELTVDGQRVWNKPLEHDRKFTVFGYKDQDIVRELVFSFPTKAGEKDQTLCKDIVKQLGEIKLKCYQATFTHHKPLCFTTEKCSSHLGKYTGTAGSFREASKRDIQESTGGQYSIATTRVGQELFRFVDTGRQVWRWIPQYRRGEFMHELSVKYRPRQTLINLGIKLPSKAEQPQDKNQDPKVLPTLEDSENTENEGPVATEKPATNVDQGGDIAAPLESASLNVHIKKRNSDITQTLSAVPEALAEALSGNDMEIRSPVQKKLKKRTSQVPVNMVPSFPDADPLLNTDKIKKRQSMIPPQTVPVFPDGTLATSTGKNCNEVLTRRTVKMRQSMIPSPKPPSFPDDEPCLPIGYVKPSPGMVITRSMRRRMQSKPLADIKNITPLSTSACKREQLCVESQITSQEELISLDETVYSLDESVIYMGDDECEILDIPTAEVTLIDLEKMDLNG